MLRKFKITIDGKEYLVEMEEIGAPSQAPVVPPVQPAVAPAPVAEKRQQKLRKLQQHLYQQGQMQCPHLCLVLS